MRMEKVMEMKIQALKNQKLIRTKEIRLYFLFIFLLIGCTNNEVVKEYNNKLNLNQNLKTFDYSSLNGKDIEYLLDIIVQKDLNFIYIGDQDIVDGISIIYKNKAMIFVYFNSLDSLDNFSDVDLEQISDYEIKRIKVYNKRSASAEIVNIKF